MSEHEPVLLGEVLEGLALMEGGWYVDGTYGRGGHSSEILARIGGRGHLLGLDKDPDAVVDGKRRFAGDPRFTIEHTGFENLCSVVPTWSGGHGLSGLLLDLGVSSPQLQTPHRGFSFSHDGPLDMRMNSESGPTVASWLATATETELVRVLREYGEEPRSRQIAHAIIRSRDQAPLETTTQLAAVVSRAAGRSKSRRHPATRAFQALRMAVNQELEVLDTVLRDCVELLSTGGRLVVISFHSLEDRIVKRFMAREARGDPAYAGLPQMPAAARPRLRVIGKLIRPGSEEIERNPRARSARLRIAERLAKGAA